MTTAPSAKFPNLRPAEPQGSDLLAAERARASFNPYDLSVFMYGEEWIGRFNRILEILENDPAMDKSKRYYSGRDDRFSHALWSARRMVELQREHKWNATDISIADFLLDESGPVCNHSDYHHILSLMNFDAHTFQSLSGTSQFSLHKNMFMPTIMSQGTDEQKAKFLAPAQKYQIIGCYAQTELGHGSNVQGLETTATYIPETDEFDLHSPTLTSSKWWIGGLGKAANHAIVMARLISNGKDYGPHPFVVQIRSLVNHRPLRGVTVGDIGPKFGFNTVDNGFVMFDHLHIPRFNMLARFASIKPNTGEYASPPNAKLSYGTMVFVRANIVMGVRFALARAATVAIRYSAVRQQFVDAANPKKHGSRVVETPVLDYTMQQYRVFPVMAQAYACYFTGKEMFRLYNDNQKQMGAGDFSLLADLHATSSGLKSLTTTMAVSAIEDCRRACGGHGYSLFSGLASFYQDYLPNATWEGDNYILTQQTARYLLKTFRNLVAGKSVLQNPTVSYLTTYLQNPTATCPATTPTDFLNPELQLSAFAHRAAHLVAQTVDQLDRQGRTWNSMLVEVNRVSRAHCQLVLVQNFLAALQSDSDLRTPERAPLKNVLTTQAQLYALHTMETELAEFLTCGYLSPAQTQMLKSQTLDLLAAVRPDAVALVDAFGLPDYYLNSALGRQDGKVYEAMTHMAEQEPLNHSDVVAGYEECIRPLVWAGKKIEGATVEVVKERQAKLVFLESTHYARLSLFVLCICMRPEKQVHLHLDL
ncbi:hypothetical protein BC936DRAFT_137317 [Jimgerdemannia flammicorona]|uniref:Acyl-coenzyme A oxidase n=1 Tax=Jimgerdemannia flammicorona TaxID=994334 RepID=A0A433CXN5_9FUNG|nr:hypothetical protein BC936DRAFT_137317 [Jimgerdemannia flammicorona]